MVQAHSGLICRPVLHQVNFCENDIVIIRIEKRRRSSPRVPAAKLNVGF